MRTIQVDEAVFAAIWSKWAEGDLAENAILRRVFNLPSSESPTAASQTLSSGEIGSSYIDKRTGIVFPIGFEIFRTFKGVPYRAVVADGVWRLTDGRTAPSLNALSALVGAATENAWTGWYYMDQGQKKLVTEMRPSTKR